MFNSINVGGFKMAAAGNKKTKQEKSGKHVKKSAELCGRRCQTCFRRCFEEKEISSLWGKKREKVC